MQENRGRVGVVIQAYLYRSGADIERLLAQGIRIRLCKGAYQEPPNVAFPDKADVDRNFVRLMQVLLPSGMYHGIATHDEKMVEATCRFAKERGIEPDQFEFQMLYGVRRDLQRSLVAGLSRAGLYSFRDRVVSLFHAPAGGTAGEPAVHGPEFLPQITASPARSEEMSLRPREFACLSDFKRGEDDVRETRSR